MSSAERLPEPFTWLMIFEISVCWLMVDNIYQLFVSLLIIYKCVYAVKKNSYYLIRLIILVYSRI